MRILVVDDDESISEFVKLALEDVGYDVRVARNGLEALGLIQHLPVDLILLDMRMPIMDGWQFAAAYRQTPEPHAPIVIITAARDAAVNAAETQAAAYLAKPFDLDRLLDLVAAFDPLNR